MGVILSLSLSLSLSLCVGVKVLLNGEIRPGWVLIFRPALLAGPQAWWAGTQALLAGPEAWLSGWTLYFLWERL